MSWLRQNMQILVPLRERCCLVCLLCYKHYFKIENVCLHALYIYLCTTHQKCLMSVTCRAWHQHCQSHGFDSQWIQLYIFKIVNKTFTKCINDIKSEREKTFKKSFKIVAYSIIAYATNKQTNKKMQHELYFQFLKFQELCIYFFQLIFVFCIILLYFTAIIFNSSTFSQQYQH